MIRRSLKIRDFSKEKDINRRWLCVKKSNAIPVKTIRFCPFKAFDCELCQLSFTTVIHILKELKSYFLSCANPE